MERGAGGNCKRNSEGKFWRFACPRAASGWRSGQPLRFSCPRAARDCADSRRLLEFQESAQVSARAEETRFLRKDVTERGKEIRFQRIFAARFSGISGCSKCGWETFTSSLEPLLRAVAPAPLAARSRLSWNSVCEAHESRPAREILAGSSCGSRAVLRRMTLAS